MRLILFILVAIGFLWVGDVLFFKGRYTHQLDLSADRFRQYVTYEWRRWTR